MLGQLVESLFSGFWGTIISFLVAMIPIIIIHEMGHFTMARLFGVWVREFGIGFPPKITKLFQWKETEFTLNWIPLGGFARMEGEAALSEVPSDKPAPPKTAEALAKEEEAERHSLYAASPAKRLGIYAGGPLMNLLTAWLLCIVLFLTGVPAARVVINSVAPDSPAEKANLQVGDVIVAIDDISMESTIDITDYTQKHLGEEVELTIDRDGETRTVNVTPRVNPPEEGAIGIGISGEMIAGRQKSYSLPKSLVLGTQYMVGITGFTLFMPIHILRGAIPLQDARPVGIVGISQIAQHSVESSLNVGSLYPFINILTIISLSLGIFNLLPIPALDGGRIVLTLVEMLRGRPLTPSMQERIHQVAFLLILALFFIITAMDILYPVELPPMP